MRTRLIPILAALAFALAAFWVGVVAGSGGIIGIHVPTSTADGIVGDHVVSLWIGDTAYGVRGSVAWRDAAGSEHDSGWPDCLTTPGNVTDVRFIGAWVWHENIGGQASILWVDCSNH